MDYQNLGCCGLVSLKTILILFKNFLNFWVASVELQNIINLSCYRSNGFALVVLNNSMLTFLGKREDAAFIHLSIVFWLYTALQYQNRKSSNFLIFHTSRGISSRLAAFLFLIFVSTSSSST